jgi:hypothetical protein
LAQLICTKAILTCSGFFVLAMMPVNLTEIAQRNKKKGGKK